MAYAADQPDGEVAGPRPISSVETESFVDGVVEDAMRVDHVSGAAVAVVQNGRAVLVKGYGAASRSPWRRVTPDTPFRIGSTTKTLTWIALMREVERGQIRLDAPVNDYLPPNARFPNAGFQRPLLVRDLMSHATGLEDLALGHLVPKVPSDMRTLARYVSEEQPRRVAPPGQFASYCNYCAVLAGYIVARIEGVDYETVIERDITGPLGMTSTSLRDPRPAWTGMPAPMPPSLAAVASDGFAWEDGDYKRLPVELTGQITPAGGAWSSAADMARYMMLILGDGTVGSTAIYDKATAQAFQTAILKTDPGINGWAHGFQILPMPGGFTGYGHNGDTILFHSNLITVPRLSLGIFVVANTDTGYKLARRLPELLVAHFYGGAESATSAAMSVDQKMLAPYTGVFIPSRRAFHGVEGFVDLLQTSAISAGAGGLVTGSDPVTWIPEGAAGRFREKDGVHVISFDFEDGKPVRWCNSFNTTQYERASWWQRPDLFALAAGLAVICALASLAGIFMRRRAPISTAIQAASLAVQRLAAVAWLVSLSGFGIWAANASNNYALIAGWPGPFITLFAWGSVLAAILSGTCLALLPPLWRTDGWSHWRKLRYSMVTAAFSTLAILVFMRGGLEIWSL